MVIEKIPPPVRNNNNNIRVMLLHASGPSLQQHFVRSIINKRTCANVEAASLPFAIASLILHYKQLAIFSSCIINMYENSESENNVKEVIGEHVFNNVP